MRIAIILSIIFLHGCATWDVQRDVGRSADRVVGAGEDVVATVPNAVGTVAAAAVFGGRAQYLHDPVDHVADEANREIRYLSNRSRRAFTEEIARRIRR